MLFGCMMMVVFGAVMLFSSPAQAGIWILPFPENITTSAHLIDNVIRYTDTVMSIFFAIVCLALLYFIVRYRSRPGHKAVYDKGDSIRHVIVTMILGSLVFFSIDAVIEHMAFRDLKEVFWNFPTGKDVLKIELMPQQFAWNVRYAGPDGEFATADDIVAPLSQMHVPVDTPVVVQMAPFDVVHAFYVPQMRIKQDATPGIVTTFWFQTTKTGKYEIACSALCGNGHYKMRGSLIVQSKDEFNQWLDTQAKESAPSDDIWAEDASSDSNSVPKDWGWKWQSKS